MNAHLPPHYSGRLLTGLPGSGRYRRLVAGVVLAGLLGVVVALLAGTPASADPTPMPTPGASAPQPGGTPSPGASGSPGVATPSPSLPFKVDYDEDPGMFDIPGQIRKAVGELLLWVAKTGLKPVLDAMGSTVLSTPDLTGNAQVTAIWTTSLVVANAVFVLFIMAGGFTVAARETLQSQYGVKQIAPRLVVGAVAANVSLLLCGKAIAFTNALTAAIAGQGVDGVTAAQAIIDMLDQPLSQNNPSIVLILLVIAVVALSVVVVMTFILRVAVLIILVGVAPMALACHAIPQTESLAYLWWRAFAACLGLQVAQTVIVLATVKVFLTPTGLAVLGIPASAGGLVGVMVCLAMLWLLVKLPGLMRHLVLGSLGRRHGRGLVGQIIHTVVMVKTIGRLAAGSRRTTRPRQTASRGQTQAANATAGRSASSPVVFSHRPAAQAPLRRAAGTRGAPVFSDAPHPATPSLVPDGPPVPVRFSSGPGPQPAQPSPPQRPPSPVRFSDSPGPVSSPTPASGTPAVTFSAAPATQRAPRRGPSPAAPVFSPAPPVPATGTGRGSAGASGTPASPASSRSRTSQPAPSSAPRTTGRTGAPAAGPSPPSGTASARPARRRPSKE